jgi:hypothetical protein
LQTSAEQEAKIDALLANRRTVFHNGRCRLMAPDRNSGRFIFVVASSGFATLVNISEAITTRIEWTAMESLLRAKYGKQRIVENPLLDD